MVSKSEFENLPLYFFLTSPFLSIEENYEETNNDLNIVIENKFDEQKTKKENGNTQDCSQDNPIKKKKDKSMLHKKRNLGVKYHSKCDKDNILRKIQVHYHTFIINYINEVLKYFGFEKEFYHIDYQFKKNITNKTFKNLKKKNISFILSQKLSTKYRKKCLQDDECNFKYCEELKKDNKYPLIKKILEQNYINLFKEVYYKNIRELTYGEFKIFLSKKVKTFDDILNNKNNDDLYKAKILKDVKENYLKETPKLHFITIKK